MSFRAALIMLFVCFSVEAEDKGWLWYDGVLTVEEPEEAKQKTEKSPAPVKETEWEKAKKSNEALKKSFSDSTDIFMHKPTVENALKAQLLQRKILNKATEASKSWTIAALMDPSLIPQSENPNNLHRKIWKEEEAAENLSLLKAASQHWGLLFEVQPGCKFCERFAPILKEFSEITGFQILAVSKSGQDYGSFKGMVDPGILAPLNPEGLAPTVYLVNSLGTKIFPIARGMVSSDDLVINILRGIKWKEEGEIT